MWKLYERTCPTLLTSKPPLEQVEELGHKCKHCFSGTVVKVLPHRIPGGKLSSLLPVLTYRAVGVDIRLLHVVRDPRASINSRIKLGWFPEFNHTKFTKMVENYCNAIIDNIEFGQNTDISLFSIGTLLLIRLIQQKKSLHSQGWILMRILSSG